MKKFFQEFKEFIAQGNVVNLAVGVIIGGAFGAIVTALTENIIQPIINCVGGAEIAGSFVLMPGKPETAVNYGAFISAIINFIIMALVVFLIVKAVNKAMSLGKKKEEEPEEAPATKVCPFCKSEIAIDATRCPHCTSEIPEEDAE